MRGCRVMGCGFLACVLLASTAGAATVTGVVQCDTNQNLTNDPADVPIPGALVIVTNLVSSFSNATYTAANGSFSLSIPNFDPLAARKDPLSQTCVERVAAVTLPPGSTILLPQPLTYLSTNPAYFIDFSIDSASNVTNLIYTSASGSLPVGNWLISSPNCGSSFCGVSGSGTIREQKRLEHSFAGNVSVMPAFNGMRPGHWTHIAHQLRLEFNGTVIQNVQCSSVTNQTGSASAVNVIQFNGRGTLKGIRGNKARFNQVFFVVRIEEQNGPRQGRDRYYLRVTAQDGTTLLLVSGDMANPEDIQPVPISTGNFRIRMAGR